MIQVIAGILLLMSAFIVFVSSLGIWRFKNIYARMHVLTKVSSLGILLLLISINLYFLELAVLVKTAIIFGILVFLSPVAAHVMARVARNTDLPDKDESDD
ncbi:MAG: monovalent cation/H(+) antiporter subunit G [Marinilabilia sp.]